MRENFKQVISVIIFVFTFAVGSVFAININTPTIQNYDFAAKHAKDLQNRLGLTNDQTNQVTNILSGYKDNIQNNNSANPSMNQSADPQKTANDRIVGLLDSNQKAAFAQMENVWWENVNKDIGTINGKNQNNSY